MTSRPLDVFQQAHLVELLREIIEAVKHGCEDCPCCYVVGAMLDPAEHLEECPFWQADELLFVPVLLLPPP